MRLTRHTAVLGLVAGALSIGLATTPAAAKDNNHHDKDKGKPKTVSLQVLSFNDYHGHIEPPNGSSLGAPFGDTTTALGGSEYLSTKLTALRATATNSLTVAAGDLIGGSPALSGIFHDEPSVETLEAMKLDVSSVGNHEFDEGLSELLRMQNGGCHPDDGCYFPGAPYDGAAFPWLAANVAYEKPGKHGKPPKPGKTVLPATWTKTIDGVKVGFIGMTLEGTPELVSPAGIAGLMFLDEVATANEAAKKLQKDKVEAIVVLVHEGGFQTGTFNGCVGISDPIATIAANLAPSIDLVVTGHTHVPYICTINDPKGQPRQVTSASSFGRVVTETRLTIDKKSRDVVRSATTSVNHLVTRETADPALTAIVAKWRVLGDPILNRIVATVGEDVTGGQINRIAETAMNNLVADALLAFAADPANGGAVIGLMNPGGVRDQLLVNAISSAGEAPGEVTYGEAFAVQPFGNVVVTLDVTGDLLKRILEQQFGRSGSRPQLVLGISEGLTYDWIAGNPVGSKVANLAFNGVPIDPAATYRVATNNFLADGGDGFTLFLEGTNRVGAGDDLTAFLDYIVANSPVMSPGTDRVNEQ